MLVIFPVPRVPLTDDEIVLEAQRLCDAFSLGETPYVCKDFLERCQYTDCLRLLELLPYPGLTLNIPFAPKGDPFFTIQEGS